VIKTIKPQLAQTAREPFDHKDWLFELKLDGVRCIAYLGNDTRLQARSGQDITAQFPELRSLHCQVVKPCILDGEIACATFNQMQHRIHKTKALDIRVASNFYPARFFAFDILCLDGQNLMPLLQMARKEALRAAMNDTPIGLVLPYREGKGIDLFREVQSLQQEGIMAKHQAAGQVLD
jgi:ATP-dependent DNA ligase